MNKVYCLFRFLLSSIFLVSCSISPIIQKEIVVTSPEVYGENSELISVVPGKYTLLGNKENRDSMLSLTIGLSINKTIPNKDVISASLKLQLLDSNGNTLADDLFLDNNNKIVDFLNTKDVGKEMMFRFRPYLSIRTNKDELDDILDKTEKIKISTDVITLMEHIDPLPMLTVSDISLPQQLKGKVEIVADDNGKIPVSFNKYDYPEIELTFRLLHKVATSDIATPFGQLWIIGLPKDSKGRTIREITPNYNEWRTSDINGGEFKAFLESEPGETITLPFSGSKSESYIDDNKAACRIARFVLNFSKYN